MRLERLVRLLAIMVLFGLVAPMPVAADHCGAAATVLPASGPAGGAFVFRTNLGAQSDLRFYRNEQLVGEVFLAGDGFVEFAIQTHRGQDGEWRAQAQVRGRPDCAAEASFTVLPAGDAPSTDTFATFDIPAWAPIVGAAGLGGLLLIVSRRRQSRI
jgi:hypothetical protein